MSGPAVLHVRAAGLAILRLGLGGPHTVCVVAMPGTSVALILALNPSQPTEEIVMQQGTAAGSNATGMGSSTANVSEKAHAGIDKLTQSAHSTVDRVVTAASSAADRIQHVGDTKYGHMAQEWKDQTCEYVRAHPMAAVGIAVAAGYLLSRLTHLR
jgi:ElaB/YqjD/DUF883 family membrane-anchored ribosome-binding protein